MITEKKKKNYIKGGARTKKFDGGGEIINVDLLMSDLEKLPISKSGYIKITLATLRKEDKFGNSHSIYENEFVPAQVDGPRIPAKAPANSFQKRRNTDDLPF